MLSEVWRNGAIMGLAQQVTNMQKIYISLPITGLDINKCRERADKVKAALSRKGYNPVSPFDIYAGKDATYEDYLCNDLRVLMECDAVYFCRGWEMSCGCNIEHSVIQILKKFNKRNITMLYER